MLRYLTTHNSQALVLFVSFIAAHKTRSKTQPGGIFCHRVEPLPTLISCFWYFFSSGVTIVGGPSCFLARHCMAPTRFRGDREGPVTAVTGSRAGAGGGGGVNRSGGRSWPPESGDTGWNRCARIPAAVTTAARGVTGGSPGSPARRDS